jgi:hypothetical protein
LAPWRANSSAHAFPIPDEAPVMMTVLFFKDIVKGEKSKVKAKKGNSKALFSDFCRAKRN